MRTDSEAEPRPLTVVTVTYGDRWKLLRETADSVLRERGVSLIIVANGVARGTMRNIDDYCQAHPGRIRVIRNDVNEGSAPAFASALQEAYRDESAILILDDDNPVEPETLPRLVRIADTIETRAGGPAAVAIHRPVNAAQSALMRGDNVDAVFRELIPGALQGFDVLSILRRAVRLPPVPLGFAHGRQRALVDGVSTQYLELPVAMWGGLYLSERCAALEVLPETSLVLYGDDNDFSRRLWASGASIYLSAELTLTDSVAWRPAKGARGWRARFPSTFRTPADQVWRLQYLFRNQAYLASEQTRGSLIARLRLGMNLVVRGSATLVLGLLAGRPALAGRLLAATFTGLRGELGRTYPIP